MNEAIYKKLDDIEIDRQVVILYACEAGSRAWGFPSPDSDYDVRFIYAHDRDWYLSFDVEHKRDVIELRADGLLDVSGWDIRKALYLFTRTNGALIEWLTSPIVYASTPPFADTLRGMVNSTANMTALCYHYSHMARRNAREYLMKSPVRIKKYLYVIRPLLAIQYILLYGKVPPVLFDELLQMTIEPQSELAFGIANLLRIKAETPELGMGNPIPVLDGFIAHELASHGMQFAGQGRPTQDVKSEVREVLNRLFRSIVR